MSIPVSFTYNGQHYVGSLSEVTGSGENMWHLMVNNYYWGRLRRTNDEWFFDENQSRIGHLVDYFAAVVQAWYQ